jgi:hypothetical protein
MAWATSRALAFFASRWVNMTNWLAAAISRAAAPVCSLRAATCSASSSNSGFLPLMVSTDLPSCWRFFSCSSTTAVFSSFFSHSRVNACKAGWVASGLGGTLISSMTPPWVTRSRRTAKLLRLSFSSAKAAALPCRACWAALAMAWESMRI